MDKEKKETHKAIASYMVAKDEHKKATKAYEKSVSSFQKKVAMHQSLAEADEDDAIYHAAAARYIGMHALA